MQQAHRLSPIAHRTRRVGGDGVPERVAPRARTRTSAAARPRARRALARPARRTWGTRRDRAARRGVRGRLGRRAGRTERSEEHTSELQSLAYLVCRLLLEKKKMTIRLATTE